MKTDYPLDWPMLIIQNEQVQGTTYYGMHFNGNGSTCDVTACDYSGGQGFRTRFINCKFGMGAGAGVHIGWECASHPGGHIASEWSFDDCTLRNTIIQGTQTVNFKFRITELSGYFVLDGSAVSMDTVRCGAAVVMFSLGWIAMLFVDEIFVDQGGKSLVDFNSYQCGSVEIDRAWTKGWNFLYRAPCSTQEHQLRLRNWQRFQPAKDGNIGYHCAFDKIEVDMADSRDLERSLSVVEPTKLEYEARVQ